MRALSNQADDNGFLPEQLACVADSVRVLDTYSLVRVRVTANPVRVAGFAPSRTRRGPDLIAEHVGARNERNPPGQLMVQDASRGRGIRQALDRGRTDSNRGCLGIVGTVAPSCTVMRQQSGWVATGGSTGDTGRQPTGGLARDRCDAVPTL